MRKQTAKMIWRITAILIVVSVIMILINGNESIEVPEELFGHWTTADAKYADRYFELSKAILEFGLGDDGIRYYTVHKIHGMRDNGRLIYTVTFTDDEDIEYSQSLYFHQNDKNRLKFKNQAGTVWHKTYNYR